MTKVFALIDAAEATVLVRHPEPGYMVVGLKIANDRKPCASMIGAFNEMLDAVQGIDQPAEGASVSAIHPVETIWRECGLPEWFLGNGGTNTKLYALYDSIRGAKPYRNALDEPSAVAPFGDAGASNYEIELVSDYWHVTRGGVLISTHTLKADADAAVRRYKAKREG